MTNYERIKAMSVEEMAEWMYNYSDCSGCVVEKNKMCETIFKCKAQHIQWLERECDT